MKNVLILLLLGMVGITFSSCGDDEPTLADQILGTWNLESVVATGCTDSSDNLNFDFGTSGCTTFMDVEICTNGTYTFTDSGTFRTGGSISAQERILEDLSAGGTYTVEGSTVTICVDSSDDCNDATVTITGSQMTVRTTDDDSGCSVTQTYFK